MGEKGKGDGLSDVSPSQFFGLPSTLNMDSCWLLTSQLCAGRRIGNCPSGPALDIAFLCLHVVGGGVFRYQDKGRATPGFFGGGGYGQIPSRGCRKGSSPSRLYKFEEEKNCRYRPFPLFFPFPPSCFHYFLFGGGGGTVSFVQKCMRRRIVPSENAFLWGLQGHICVCEEDLWILLITKYIIIIYI